MECNRKVNIFKVPNDQPSKPVPNIYAKRPTNVFSESNQTGTNIWSQSSQQPPLNLNPPSLLPQPAPILPKQPYVNVFAGFTSKPNFEEPLRNQSSIDLTLAPVAPKVQSPPRNVPNVFAPNPLQRQPQNIFLLRPSQPDQLSNLDSVSTVKETSAKQYTDFSFANPIKPPRNQQNPTKIEEKPLNQIKLQKQKAQPKFHQKHKEYQGETSGLPQTPINLQSLIISQIEIHSEPPQLKSQQGSLIADTSKVQVAKDQKASSYPPDYSQIIYQDNIQTRQRVTSFQNIMMQQNAKNSQKTLRKNPQLNLIEKQPTKNQQQSPRIQPESPYKLSELKDDNLRLKQEKKSSQKKKEEKNYSPSPSGSPQTQKNNETPVKNISQTPSHKKQDKETEQKPGPKVQQRQEICVQVKTDFSKKNNRILQTINERSFEQSVIEIKQRRSEILIAQADEKNSSGPSYMDLNTSNNLSYMENVSSSDKTAQKQFNNFKMTSSKKVSSSNEQKDYMKKSDELPKAKDLTKSESIERKNQVNVVPMTESLKISDKKPEQSKKEPSSEKKPKQTEPNDQSLQSFKKQLIYGRKPLKESLDKQFKNIVIPKETIKRKQAESEQEYDLNQQNLNDNNKTQRNQTPKMQDQKNNFAQGQSSTIESLRQKAKNLRKPTHKTDIKKPDKNFEEDHQRKPLLFQPVSQVNDKHKYLKKQINPVKNEQKPETKQQTINNQQKPQDHEQSDAEELVLPGFQRVVTFGSDRKEIFSSVLAQQKLQKKGSLADKNLSKPQQPATKPPLQSSPLQQLRPIEQTLQSSQQSPQRHQSSPSLSRIKDSSELLSQPSTPELNRVKDSFSSSEKKKHKKYIEDIKLQYENVRFDIDELKLVCSDEMRIVREQEKNLSQTVFELEGREVVLNEDFYRVFQGLYESSMEFLRLNCYLSEIDLHRESNNIPDDVVVRDQMSRRILQITEKICDKIPIKLAQIYSLFDNYDREITQEKALQLEKIPKQPLKQTKNLFFSILNLVKNKYCSVDQQKSPTLKPKPITQYKSYAKLKSSLIGIIEEKKTNLSKLQERTKNCLQQQKTLMHSLHKKTTQQCKGKTPTNTTNKFRQVLLERQQRQKKETLQQSKPQKNNNTNVDKFWEKLFKVERRKLVQQDILQKKKQLVVRYFSNLAMGYSYMRFQKFGEKYPKEVTQEQKHKQKTPIQKYNEIIDIKSKYIKMQQNFIKCQPSNSKNNIHWLNNTVDKSKNPIQEDIIEEKRKLNQQMIVKANNISVRLKNLDFKLVPYISSKLIQNY